MMNFRQYPNCTKIVIPRNVRLSTTNFSGAFTNMQNLQYLDIDKNIEDKIDVISNGYSSGSLCYNCSNLIKSAVCGPNVTDMSYAYTDCTNLTTAVCGPNVTNMSETYSGCINLTTSVCGPNVTDMGSTYMNCINIQGNSYLYSPNVNVIKYCFYGRNTSNMLNIYVQENSITMNTCLINDTLSVIGNPIEWTTDSTNNRYYNTSANIYIYPVANVYQAKIDNGD